MKETEKKEQIEAIYKEYLTKLKELQKEQQKIIDDFVETIEQKKLEQIRKKL